MGRTARAGNPDEKTPPALARGVFSTLSVRWEALLPGCSQKRAFHAGNARFRSFNCGWRPAFRLSRSWLRGRGAPVACPVEFLPCGTSLGFLVARQTPLDPSLSGSLRLSRGVIRLSGCHDRTPLRRRCQHETCLDSKERIQTLRCALSLSFAERICPRIWSHAASSSDANREKLPPTSDMPPSIAMV